MGRVRKFNLRDGHFSQVCICCMLSGTVGNIFLFIDHIIW